MTSPSDDKPPAATRSTIRVVLWLAVVALAMIIGTWLTQRNTAPKPRPLLPHQAYVWQRQWRPAVSEAIRTASGEIGSFSLLAAEMQWKNGTPEIRRITPDWAVLRELKAPPGVVLRVFPSLAPTGWSPPAVDSLSDLIAKLSTDFRSNNVPIGEVQIDYDCPESKLADFLRLVRELKRRHPTLTLSITALPTWLPQSDFAQLAREVPGYVLQVHSLQLPKSRDRLVTLCDPAEACGAVQRAANLRVPFRVALPTYSCVVVFDSSGKVTEVYAEDLPSGFPQTSDPFIVMDADAYDCAGLISTWQRTGPAELQSIIWYRLPVESDRLNWTWPTLAKLIRNQPLRRGWKIDATRNPASQHHVITVRNDGDAPDDFPRLISVRAESSRIAASDGLRGYVAEPQPDASVRFRLTNPAMHPRVPPGTSVTIGWCRTTSENAAVTPTVISP
jgi:hypothetical protein